MEERGLYTYMGRTLRLEHTSSTTPMERSCVRSSAMFASIWERSASCDGGGGGEGLGGVGGAGLTTAGGRCFSCCSNGAIFHPSLYDAAALIK